MPPQTVPSVRLPDSPRALRARRNTSSEALRVNVRSMIRAGSIPCETSQATRAARVLVLHVTKIIFVRVSATRSQYQSFLTASRKECFEVSLDNHRGNYSRQ
jgi:hypothetical protein